jgi:glutaconate CoA-transferase subunit B
MTDTVGFLVRAAREYLRGGTLFTGFHWPVLAGQVAARLDPDAFTQVFEAGAAARGPASSVPTSTTDYAALDSSLVWRGGTPTVLPGVVRRADRVVLDAANVDLTGRVNSTAVGPYERPTVRLPGGGGAADAAFAARELVLLYGAEDPSRIVTRVEHVTAAPAPGAVVRLLTRWGTLRLDGGPRLVERVGDPPPRFEELGVALGDAAEPDPPSPAEREAAEAVLAGARAAGYRVAAGR